MKKLIIIGLALTVAASAFAADTKYKADVPASLITPDTWSDLYLSTVDLEGAIGSGKVKLAKGDVNKTTEAFDMFDRYQPGKNYKVPPYHH